MDRPVTDQLIPTFLPPLKEEAHKQYRRLGFETVRDDHHSSSKESTKHQGTSFLRSSIKSNKEQSRISAFDPSNKSLPKYLDKDESARDINSVRHLLNGKDVKMSNVLWELSLRKDAYIPVHNIKEIMEKQRKKSKAAASRYVSNSQLWL